MANARQTIMIEDAEIFHGSYRNFSGNPTLYNPDGGKRTFAVAIPESLDPKVLDEDGWNIKYTKPRDEDDEPKPFLTVEVGFKFPPTIVLITSKARTKIGEDTVETLDWVNIKTADLIINPGFWSNPAGESGIKAWLKSLYITVEEDALELKYAQEEQAHE